MRWIGVSVIFTLLLLPAAELLAQEANGPKADAAVLGSGAGTDGGRQSMLAWTPAALEALAQRAEVRNSFVLDRSALGLMQALAPDGEDGVRPVLRKLDGISVHLYRFHDLGPADEAQLEAVRRAYEARGWKHLVSEGGTAGSARKKTDLWLVLDGMEVRGGTMMLVTPKSVSVVTFAGDLNPIDILRLRGHFGIPAASGDSAMNQR